MIIIELNLHGTIVEVSKPSTVHVRNTMGLSEVQSAKDTPLNASRRQCITAIQEVMIVI